MTIRTSLLIAAMLVAGCGARSNSQYAYRTAPNPNGCYAEVFAQDSFKGAHDFINGPNRYARVSEFRRGENWQGDGIRSVRTGPSSTITVWSEERYRGSLLKLGPDQSISRVDEALSGKGISVEISCSRIATE